MRKLPFYFICIVLLASCSARKKAMVSKQPYPAPPSKAHPGIQQPIAIIDDKTLIKKYTAAEYIDQFSGIAVAEMNAYGIPASITLAQGLLESGNGNGTLARLANNHFGIKCNIDWKGKTILQDDDNKDDCFRVYNSPEESFRDHSEFLKRNRYATLFSLDKNDYAGWARGLKQAGYATNPQYAQLLISLIERYQLNRFDSRDTPVEKKKREESVIAEIAREIPQEVNKAAAKAPVAMKIYEVKAGDTLYSISRRFDLSVDDLKLLNNIQGTDLSIGQLLLVSK
jgi:hypothetical protein